MKGIVTLEFVNKDTGKSRKIQNPNLITNYFYTNQLIVNTTDFFRNQFNNPVYLILSQYAGPKLRNLSTPNELGPGLIASPNVASRTYNNTAIPFFEVFHQFPNPGVDRPFQTIIFSSGQALTGNNPQAHAYTVLDDPCIQGANEFLNLYYRIQAVEETAERDAGLVLGLTQEHAITFFRFAWANSNAGLSSGTPNNQAATGFSIAGNRFTGVPVPVLYQYPQANSSYAGVGGLAGELGFRGFVNPQYEFSISTNPALFSATKNYSIPNGEHVGSLIRGYSTGCNGEFDSSLSENPLNFNSPQNIQGVFKHASNATGPFFDALTNGSSGGSISVAGTWSKNVSELYYLLFEDTGSVGSGTYRFKRRRITGFAGNTWESQAIHLPYFNRLIKPFANSHGLDPTAGDLHVYDEQRIVFWDANGVTLLNVFTGAHQTWDADSLPALGATDIRQCSVNYHPLSPMGDGVAGTVIYVACAVTGLYRITPALNTISLLSSTPCYGVDVGFDNEAVALFDGRVSVGPNFTLPVPFDFTGISDNNWDTVAYLKVDADVPNYNTLIVRNNNSTAWWSTAAEEAVPGPTIPGLSSFVHGRVDVSPYDSNWVARGTDPSLLYRLTHAVSSTTNIHGATSLRAESITFVGADILAYKNSRTAPSSDKRYAGWAGSGGTGPALQPFNVNKSQYFLYNPATAVETPGISLDLSGTDYQHVAYLGYGIFYYSTTRSRGGDPRGVAAESYLIHSPSDLFEEQYGWDGSNWQAGSLGVRTLHSSVQNLIDGITVAFQNALTGTSFVAGNYVTFGASRGMLKDNATSLTFATTFYTKTTFKKVPFSSATVNGGAYAPPIVSNPLFISLLNDYLSNFSVSLNGVPALVRLSGSPNPGEVRVNANGFTFNAVDEGKTITGTYSYLMH